LNGKLSFCIPYIVASIAVGSTLLLTIMLHSLISPTIYILFVAAVAVSAWYGGLSSGIFATILSVLLINYFFINPKFSLSAYLHPDTITRLIIFLLVTTIVNFLNSELRIAKDKLEKSLQQLKTSESKFRRLVEANIIGVMVADINGNVVEANDAFLKMIGYTREDLLASRINCQNMTPPEYQDMDKQLLDELLINKILPPFEKEYIRKDDTRFIALIGLALLEKNSQQVIGYVLDLSESKQNEKRLRRLVESNIFGVAFGDSGGGINYANDYVLNMLGYSQEDIHSGAVRWSEITPPEYADLDQRALAAVNKQGLSQPYEKEYIRKDGTRVPILIGLVALEEPYNQQEVAFYLDLSTQKAALRDLQLVESTLRQREEQLRLITNALPVQISYIDAEQRYRFNNRKYEEWFGIPATEIYGKHIQELLGESTYQSILHHVEAVLSGEKVNYELLLQHRDGSNHFMNVSYIPQFNQQEQVEGFVVLIQDITERKQAEQEREQLLEREQVARAEAEAANRIKDEFLATLSHELRTPLNAILGWTQLLKSRKFDGATTNKAMDTIDRNGRALSQLIEDILDVSRIIRGKLCLNTQPLNLTTVIQAAIDSVLPAADAKEITIELQFEDSVGMVVADANRLQQIIWNLLVNAVKFTPKRGKVEVKLRRINSRVEIRVTDTGMGIDPEFLPYLYERFRQADSSTTRSHGGLGLGLAIVRHLVELHGGTVAAESEGIGKGASFIVNLPMKAVAIPSTSPEPKPSLLDIQQHPLPILEGLRVLVVDDEVDARQLLSTILGEYGAEVIAVASTQAAISALPQFSPHILVSDIGMPDEDGYTLIRRVRNLPPDQGGRIPAVALTAYARAEDRTKALLAGFQLHIPKPVDPTELAAVVANLAGRT
jgi:PAS domain S-box-containing protein